MTVTVISSSFDSTPDELLNRANEIERGTGARPESTAPGGRSPLTTSDGLTGVVEPWDGVSSEGPLAA